MKKYKTVLMALCVVAGGGMASFAHAVDPVGQQPILERVFQGLSPKGIKLGTFDIYPSLDTAVHYTSNVLKDDSDEQSEKIYRVRGNVSAIRKTDRADIELLGGVEQRTYQKTTDFNHLNFRGYSGLTYRFSPAIEGKFALHGIRSHQTRYETSSTRAAFDPVQVDEYGFRTDFKLRPGSIGWNLHAGFKDISHEDSRLFSTGQTVVQRDRDRQVYFAGVDARVNRLSDDESGYTPFLGLSINRADYKNRDYDDATNDFTGVDQSATRYDMTAGLDLRTGGKLRGVVRAGVGLYDPDDGSLDRQTDGVVDIDLTYLYTPLTNFVVGVDRFFTNDTDRVGGTLQTRLSAKVVHELTRRWIITSEWAYTDRSFENDGEDQTWEGGVGFTHRLNERFAVNGDLKYISRESNQENGDYDETRAMIRLQTRF